MADKNEMEMDELQDDLLLGSDDEEEIISDLDDDMILDEDTLKIAEAYLSDEEEEEDIDFGSEDEEEEAELDFEDRPKRRFYDEEDVEVADEIDFGESKETDSAMLTEMAESPEGFVVGKFCKVRDKHGHNDCVGVIRDIYFEYKKPAKTRLTLLTFPYNHDNDQIKYDTSYEIIQYDENGNVDVSADFIATKAKSAIGKSYLSWLNQPSLADARSTLRRRGIQGFVFSDKKRVNGRIVENFIVEAPAFMDIVTFKRFDYVDESSRRPSGRMLHEGRKPRHLRESARRTLNELNWKTYANAGKKTVEKGGSIHAQRELNPNGNPKEWLSGAVDAKIRGDKFYDRAKKQFNKDYGYKRGKRYDDDYLEAGMGGDFTAIEEFGPHAVGYRDKGFGEPATYEGKWNDYEMKEMTPEEFFDDEKAAKSYRNSQEEIKNWKKGNYEYEKGKGYVKKIRESRKLRKSRMMKEAVRQARRNHKLQESRKMRSPFSKRRFR